MPPCVNPRCNGNHYINECPIKSDDEAKRLTDTYRANKEDKGADKGHIRLLGGHAIDSHSGLFRAPFAKGALESVVLADQGADTQLNPPAIFKALRTAILWVARIYV